MALVQDRFGCESPARLGRAPARLGQLDPGSTAAIVPPFAETAPGLASFYLTAVAAGVTVWLVTRWLDGRGRRGR